MLLCKWGSFVKFALLKKRTPPAADPVNEEALSDNRKMITNQQVELYNQAAADVLQADGRGSRVKLLAASRQAALETIGQSDDGLHLPESTRSVVGRRPPPPRVCSSAAQGRGSGVDSSCASSVSGSHGAHELRVQQAAEAHRRLLLPGAAPTEPPPEALGLLLPGLGPALPAPPPPGQQPPPAARSPRRGEPGGEEAGQRSCAAGSEGPGPGPLQDGRHHGVFLPLRQSRRVHEGAEVLQPLHLLHPAHLHLRPGAVLQREQQGGEIQPL